MRLRRTITCGWVLFTRITFFCEGIKVKTKLSELTSRGGSIQHLDLHSLRCFHDGRAACQTTIPLAFRIHSSFQRLSKTFLRLVKSGQIVTIHSGERALLKSCWYSTHTRARAVRASPRSSHLKRVGLLYQQSVRGKSSLDFLDNNCRVEVISVAVSWRSHRRDAEPTRAASRAKLMPWRFKCRFCASTTCRSSQTDDALTCAKWHFYL